MGAIAQQAQQRQLTTLSPQKSLQQVLQRSWDRIAAVMPREMNEQRLYQMFVSAINREPKLAECTIESVLSCFMRCTSLGLEPSNVNGLGMAYILPYGNKNYRTGQSEATLIIGYKGMIELARRSGDLKSIHAQAVYEVDAIMRRSSSAKAKTTPWKTDYEAMALKTVIRRSFKYLPVSTEARTAAESDGTTPDYSDVFTPTFPTIETDAPLEPPVDTTEFTPPTDPEEDTTADGEVTHGA